MSLSVPNPATVCPCGLRARMSNDAWAYHRLSCAYWVRQATTGSTLKDRKRMKAGKA